MTRWNTLLTCALFTLPALADQTITLEDGKEIRLKDDFTWEYISNQNDASKDEFQSVPVAKSTKGTTITIGDNKPSLQLSKSGIDILIGAGLYENGNLTLPVSITNQSSQAIVLVTLKVAVHSLSGELLYQDTINTWQSIKRLADTYLRPQTSAEGKPLSVEVEQYPQYQLTVEVTEVTAR
ncbi:DUF3157 family protein [Vibrio makurazakiensis]|uniref:DUF3157 family protein n=1 Tax=Vibrio makurazakiensis TaxID=2910250 RepID=UPI003D0A0EA1